MAERAYVDANVIVYAVDPDVVFHGPAVRFWNEVARGDVVVAISPQVLHEAYVAMTKRMTHPLPPADAARILIDVLDTPGLLVLPAGRLAIAEALREAGTKNKGAFPPTE